MFAFAALAFVGCSKSTDVSDSSRTKQSDAYANNFVQKYGQPAANHTWGFGGTTGTRSVYSNQGMLGNQIAGGMMAYAPKNVDDDSVNPNETKLVVDEFSKHRPGVTNQLNINLTDFWVHQVYKGNSKYLNGNYYKAKNNGDVTNASDKMNHLQCFKDCTFEDLNTNQDNQGKYTLGNGFMEHIDNFNSGNNTSSQTVGNQSITSAGARIVGATLMINSGTQDFAYHNSEDSKYHNEYIIIAGADIDPTLVLNDIGNIIKSYQTLISTSGIVPIKNFYNGRKHDAYACLDKNLKFCVKHYGEEDWKDIKYVFPYMNCTTAFDVSFGYDNIFVPEF